MPPKERYVAVLIAAILTLSLVLGVPGLFGVGTVHAGEEVHSAQDNEDPLYPINYTFVLRNHQPGHQNGYAEHYAEGLTENITLHWIVVSGEGFNFDDCEPGNTQAFGIDRHNDERGTVTDESLLNSYKSYSSNDSAIRISYFKEDGLAGGPVDIHIDDQIVASQGNCYDNPDQPGWYRLRGKINGSSNGDTTTDYLIYDYTDYIYVCDCANRQEAREKLGPPPSEQSSSTSNDGGSTQQSSTATPAPQQEATATPRPQQEATATPQPPQTTATATPKPERQAGGSSDAQQGSTPTPDAGGQSTTTPGDGQSSGTTRQSTATATASGGASNGNANAEEDRATDATGASQSGADLPRTPTAGAGPGLGVLAALAGLALTGLLVGIRRREE